MKYTADVTTIELVLCFAMFRARNFVSSSSFRNVWHEWLEGE